MPDGKGPPLKIGSSPRFRFPQEGAARRVRRGDSERGSGEEILPRDWTMVDAVLAGQTLLGIFGENNHNQRIF